MIAQELPARTGADLTANIAAAAALDVGASKTTCLAASAGAWSRQSSRSIGVGVQNASPTGTPRDFEDCARAIRIAVAEAERGAQASVQQAIAAYSGPGLGSHIVTAQAKVRGGEVMARDAQAALAAALQAAPPAGRSVLHVEPLGYSVDGGAQRSAIYGARGRMLSVEACIVTGPAPAVAALRQCISAAGLEPAQVVAGPYAAALAATSEDERVLGVLVLDLGGGGTGMACLCADGIVLVDHIPIGGTRMTRDLAAQLDTTFAAAERAKMLHGVVGGRFDPLEAIEAPRLGRNGRLEPQIVSKQAIADALASRFEEILIQVRARLRAAALEPARTPQRVVLVGGGARIAGAREAAQEALGLPVRIGHPIGIADLGSARAGPAFATVAGLLSWRDHRPDAGRRMSFVEPSRGNVGAKARAAAASAWAWLKENF